MTKIIKSLSVIAFVGVIAIGGTIAYFSDTETSPGNTFTAGAIDLTVDSEQHYNGNICTETSTAGVYEWVGEAEYPVAGTTCYGTWEATDLGVEKFFDFNDIKPGDSGENTISLHVEGNDAYACMDIMVTKNDDMTCTGPELKADADPTCVDPGTEFDGELAQNIYFTAWEDDGNNVWDLDEDLILVNHIFRSSGESFTLANYNKGPLTGGTTTYIGLAWCAGQMVVIKGGTSEYPTNIISCRGAGMKNDCQTDSMELKIAFRAEQERHNRYFTCALPY